MPDNPGRTPSVGKAIERCGVRRRQPNHWFGTASMTASTRRARLPDCSVQRPLATASLALGSWRLQAPPTELGHVGRRPSRTPRPTAVLSPAVRRIDATPRPRSNRPRLAKCLVPGGEITVQRSSMSLLPRGSRSPLPPRAGARLATLDRSKAPGVSRPLSSQHETDHRGEHCLPGDQTMRVANLPSR
jgi:hypothetical protein